MVGGTLPLTLITAWHPEYFRRPAGNASSNWSRLELGATATRMLEPSFGWCLVTGIFNGKSPERQFITGWRV
jgi:hypothetical protein